MKTILTAAFAAALLSVGTLAIANDTVVLANKKGDVTFNHKKHSESFVCSTCHGEGEPRNNFV